MGNTLATANDDWQFSDIVSWVITATIYGEQHNITKNESLCEPYSDSRSVDQLRFLNAVYCIGNLAVIYDV